MEVSLMPSRVLDALVLLGVVEVHVDVEGCGWGDPEFNCRVVSEISSATHEIAAGCCGAPCLGV
jgi:hypothetical protein